MTFERHQLSGGSWPNVSPDKTRLEDAAARLYHARELQTPIAPLAKELDIVGADAAYHVQDINTSKWLEQGRRLSGRKIGLTSKAVQNQLGVDQPDFGMLYQDMEFVDGETVPFDRFMQPRAEAEIAFRMGKDVTDADLTPSRFSAAVDAVLPAIEIVDSAIADWKITFEDTVADNASSGLYVIGQTPFLLSNLDLELAGMIMRCNGETVSLGVGAACLGHPLNAALWLARTMVDRGRPLQAGDIILSGALGPMAALQPGDHFEAVIGGLGSVGAHLAQR